MTYPYKITGYTVEPDGEKVFIEFHNEATNHAKAHQDRLNMEHRLAPKRKVVITNVEMDFELIVDERESGEIMSEPNIREIAEKLMALPGINSLAADWLRLTLTEDLYVLAEDIRRFAATREGKTVPARCAVYLGGYQPVPLQCRLPVHLGLHAGIGDDGRTVIWPEQPSDMSGQLRASEAARERQGREIAGLREALGKIVAGAKRRFSQDPPPEELQSLRDHDSGARLAWSAAAKIARAALAAVPPAPATDPK